MKLLKCVGLYEEKKDLHRDWLFRGTEHLVRYPKHNFANPAMGIMSFGAVKLPGFEDVYCYRASKENEQRLAECGWHCIKRMTHYIVVTRNEPKVYTTTLKEVRS